MLQDSHINIIQSVGLVKATLSVAAPPRGEKILSSKRECDVMDMVFMGVARIKRHCPKKPTQKPCLLGY
ncbi:hypothetical protein DSO57_1011132 [Entomophthora muscae]|uniref:Uncharacterized protein n=1 Tax=Entomophthora muscae TaxID=34485 RepID=A0ACC2U4J1_9FUNG|nr:hypothetical protein DSO57_1011132 [Entomophthora muscae]